MQLWKWSFRNGLQRLLFESDSNGVHIRPIRSPSVFEKYRGIGTPGVGSGRRAINRWLREMRGE
jgi:hypothetical protein